MDTSDIVIVEESNSANEPTPVFPLSTTSSDHDMNTISDEHHDTMETLVSADDLIQTPMERALWNQCGSIPQDLNVPIDPNQLDRQQTISFIQFMLLFVIKNTENIKK